MTLFDSVSTRALGDNYEKLFLFFDPIQYALLHYNTTCHSAFNFATRKACTTYYNSNIPNTLRQNRAVIKGRSKLKTFETKTALTSGTSLQYIYYTPPSTHTQHCVPIDTIRKIVLNHHAPTKRRTN